MKFCKKLLKVDFDDVNIKELNLKYFTVIVWAPEKYVTKKQRDECIEKEKKLIKQIRENEPYPESHFRIMSIGLPKEEVLEMLIPLAAYFDLILEICPDGSWLFPPSNHFMSIANPDRLSPENEFWTFYPKYIYKKNQYFMLLTKKPDFKIPDIFKKFLLPYPPDTLTYNFLKTSMLKAIKSTRQGERKKKDYDRKTFRILKIFLEMSTRRDKSLYPDDIKDLCDEFNVSERTIKRDITLLNSLGEFIEYDRQTKSYKLIGGNYSMMIENYFEKKFKKVKQEETF